MTNPRISAKERGLIKGSLRRVFSRSELRRKVLSSYLVDHEDPKRPRVGRWGYCTECGVVTPLYLLEIDHKDPIIPVDRTLEQMSWDDVIDRIWCLEHNLLPVCKPCHREKTKRENKLRRKKK